MHWNIAAAAALAVIWAASPADAATQQDKMKACNTEAAGKKLSGDARKSFMGACLSGGSAMPATASKADPCTSLADSKKLSGAARTSFVKKCSAG